MLHTILAVENVGSIRSRQRHEGVTSILLAASHDHIPLQIQEALVTYLEAL